MVQRLSLGRVVCVGTAVQEMEPRVESLPLALCWRPLRMATLLYFLNARHSEILGFFLLRFWPFSLLLSLTLSRTRTRKATVFGFAL